MSPVLFLITVFLVGFATGLRTFTPLALICWVAVWGWLPLESSRIALLGTETGAIVVSFLALIELVGDKIPSTPARTSLGPLGARILIAIFAAAALAIGMGQSWIAAIVCGPVASVLGAYAGLNYRTSLPTLTGARDIYLAIVEDLITIGLTLVGLKLLFG